MCVSVLTKTDKIVEAELYEDIQIKINSKSVPLYIQNINIKGKPGKVK